MKRVFVSYSRRNKRFTERLARDLGDAGLDVWVDWRQIQGGENWQDEIFNGIERSDFIVLVLSPSAVQSEWVQREVLTAREQGKPIIPVMAEDSLEILQATESMRWVLDIQFVDFQGGYEEAFPQLLEALPSSRIIGAFDVVDTTKITNPFKGLEAFQQTDSHFFFGREELIRKCLKRIQQDGNARFLAVVGASGSGKSSLVRAGVIPEIRSGTLKQSDQWRILIFTPGITPIDALAHRLEPLLADLAQDQIAEGLMASEESLHHFTEQILKDEPSEIRNLIVVDQFEEVFTNAGEVERRTFLNLLHHAVTIEGGRTQVIITMRADFFGQLSRYPLLADLFEQENMVIATEMSPANILRAIEGPAQAVGLIYDEGLPQRILDDVRKQAGSLPLLQYALKELYERRDGRKLTDEAYNIIGGVQRALAQHAEDIYKELDASQQSLMRRVLLRLVEISEAGEVTRRRVAREDLHFRDVPQDEVQKIIDLLTAPESRLLIASRQIKVATADEAEPKIWIEVGHEALFREWVRFTGWVSENLESLRLSSELSQSAMDWRQSQQDPAYLLRGNRLIRAEGWQETADTTALQREFIDASIAENDRQLALEEQRAELEKTLIQQSANRLRNFVIVLIVSLIVAIGLSIVALDSSNQAQRDQERANNALATATFAQGQAEQNAQEAQSLALAASADRLLGDNETDLSLALALEANFLNNPPPQSQRTLAEIAYSPATRLVFDQHDNAVNAVIFSPDDRFAVSADGRTMILWDVLTGTVVWRVGEEDTSINGHTRTINALDFSSDGTQIVSGGNDGVVIIWDATNGAELHRFTGHTGAVNAVAFHPIQKTKIFSADSDGLIVLWDYVRDEVERSFTNHQATINTFTLNNNATRLVSGDSDGMVFVWNTISGGACNFAVSTRVNSLDFNPRRQMVAVGSSDGVVSFWNTRTCSFIDQYTEHSDLAVNDLEFTSDGNFIVSGGNDNTLILYDIDETDIVDIFIGQEGTIRALDNNSAGTQLLSASGDGTIRLWDTTRSELIRTFVGHTVFRQNTNRIVARFSPDEQFILSASGDNSLRLWDTNLGLYVQEYSGHTEGVNDVVFNADGTQALSASNDDSLILWDVMTGEIIQQFMGHTDDVTRVLFLPDNERALSASDDSTLILWNLTDGTIIQQLGVNQENGEGHTKTIFDLALSPDGTLVASSSDDETILVWDLNSFQVIQSFADHKSSVDSVEFHPNGESLISGGANGRIIWWNLSDASIIRQFNGHNSAVFDIDFSPDGTQIVTGGRDDTIRVWDVDSGFETRRYDTPEAVNSVDFSNDGQTVLTGLDDATLRLWRVLTDLDDLINWTILNRHLIQISCEDREFFRLETCTNNIPPESIDFPVSTPTPVPDNVFGLSIGGTAVVNVDTILQVRQGPGTNFAIITSLTDGAIVTLLDGPRIGGQFMWWEILAEDGSQGWVVQSVPSEGILTLLAQ